jgi:spermidine synthase
MILPLFFGSGAVGLVYQIVWLRELTLVFGATAYASSAVLATFMGGLALGSLWAARRADAWGLAPLRAYGALELGIAGYASLIPLLLSRMTPLLGLAWRAGASEHFVLFGLLKLAAIAVLILPATTLMGATLPVLARSAGRWSKSLGGSVGALYAANTFGAVLGTLLSAFALLPTLGMRRTLGITVSVNAAIGLAAWALGSRALERSGTGPAPPRAVEEPRQRSRLRTLALIFAGSGFAAMVIEVAWTRGLALTLGSSVYAYAAMLTAFLLGLAGGAAAAARVIARRRVNPAVALSVALSLAAVATAATAHVLQWLPRAFGEIYFRFKPSPDGWLLVEVVLALVVMFPATFALGWVFPLVLEILGPVRSATAAVGRAYAANTFGTIGGALTGGFVAIPLLGVSDSLVTTAVVQGLLALVVAAVLVEASPKAGRAAAVLAAAVMVASVVARPSWDLLLMNSGVYMKIQDIDPKDGWKGYLARVKTDNQAVYAKDGLTASVFVGIQPSLDNLYLTVNGKTDASSRLDTETQIVAGHLPLLLHPDPKDILIVGLASGMTVGSAARHPVDRIRVVEVEPAMVGAARCFSSVNYGVLDDPRVTLSLNDARNELQFNSATYDVIVSEPSNPWMTVASNLFTEDFFRIARTRLRPGGVFGQWIQMYCLTPEYLRSVLAAFRASFPSVLVFETGNGVDLIMLGSDRPLRLDFDALRTRMSEFQVMTDLSRVRIRGPEDLAGMLQTGGDDIDRITAGAHPNTDDNGYVEFAAPKLLYAETIDPNLAMLQGNGRDPLTPLRPLFVNSPDDGDLRLGLVVRWVRRDDRPRAKTAIEHSPDPALRDRANEILAARRQTPP